MQQLPSVTVVLQSSISKSTQKHSTKRLHEPRTTWGINNEWVLSFHQVKLSLSKSVTKVLFLTLAMPTLSTLNDLYLPKPPAPDLFEIHLLNHFLGSEPDICITQQTCMVDSIHRQRIRGLGWGHTKPFITGFADFRHHFVQVSMCLYFGWQRGLGEALQPVLSISF